MTSPLRLGKGDSFGFHRTPPWGTLRTQGQASFPDSAFSVHSALRLLLPEQKSDSEEALLAAWGWWPNRWVDLQIIVTEDASA